MEEQSVTVKNKKIKKTTFDDLSSDLKIEILCKFSGKELACLTAVSPSWHNFITFSCFPTMAPSPLPYSGSIYIIKGSLQAPRSEDSTHDLRHQASEAHLSFGSISLDKIGSHQSNVKQVKLLASCNGLVLVYRGNSYNLNMEKRFYDSNYYVINPANHLHVEIPKPSPLNSSAYATLAYHPAESSYFKIVRFQSVHLLNIFDSETGVWTTLRFQLEKDVTNGWIERCVYLEGAIYRLSWSGHLVRFLIDKVVSNKDLAMAINLPEAFVDRFDIQDSHIGLSSGKIHFAIFDRDRVLKIWALNHEDCQWFSKCNIDRSQLYCYRVHSIAFHPYEDVIFFHYFGWRTTNLITRRVRYYQEQDQKAPRVEKEESLLFLNIIIGIRPP